MKNQLVNINQINVGDKAYRLKNSVMQYLKSAYCIFQEGPAGTIDVDLTGFSGQQKLFFFLQFL